MPELIPREGTAAVTASGPGDKMAERPELRPAAGVGEPADVGGGRAGDWPSRTELNRAEPGRVEPRAEPRAEPNRVEPSRAEPSRAKPRAEPSREPNVSRT